jgi:hypothetical protein
MFKYSIHLTPVNNCVKIGLISRGEMDMAKQAIIDANIILYFDNLPEEDRLRYHNTFLTASVLPDNFRFIDNPYPPATMVSTEKKESTSLVI